MDRTPTFVLVHGGRHGGWCWRKVASVLRARGHVVYTPTLTGLGERSHLLARDIDLHTHVRDIIGVFEYEGLTDVVLASHSYGGMVCAGALEHIAERVRRYVLIDARLPLEGESLMDLVGPSIGAKVRAMVAEHGEGWYVPVEDSSFWGLDDPEQIAWVNSKITPQPFASYTDPSGPVGRAWRHPGTFVEGQPSMNNGAELERLRRRSKQDEHFHYRTMPGGHEPMITNPQLLVDFLIEASTAP